jgi:16S rRNA (cytidine1402-2'-O)-methyltransferase
MADPVARGLLYVVATPIGNLEDITHRAVRVLREASLIACEDTRQTRKLLDHYNISKPALSYHEHNEAERAGEIVSRLEAGETIALVSDAGMPGISDPGYRVIRLAIDRGLTVVPVPGPSALIAALVGSGVPTDAFEFRGFLPARSGQRRTALEALRSTKHPVVLYEAPHRIGETLEDIMATLGPGRPLVIARELTKMHEEFLRGTAGELRQVAATRTLKGEITLVIAPSTDTAGAASSTTLAARLQEIVSAQNVDEKDALKILARETGLSKSEIYREVQRSKAAQHKKKNG